MSYSNSFPTQRPTTFDFANSGKLDSRISFSRSDSTPSNVHYRSNEKNKSSENLLQYSNPITSHWSEINTVITTGSVAAPDGTTTASKVLETSATGYHETRETFACTNSVLHTATFFAKANGRTVIRFLPRTSSGVIANVEFTLSGSGSESLISGTATRSIAAVGSADGWYKMTVGFTGNATATGDFQINICEAASTDSYAGNSSLGIYLWGCQISSLGEQILNSTSGSIHREYSSTLKSVASSGQPRFEYDPITGESEGLLIEQQSTNLTVASEEVNNWTVDSATVQQNVAISPAGTLTADLLTDDASGPRPHYVYKSTALGVSVGSTVYTVSFHAKASGHSELQTYDNNQNTSANLTVNLANGTITSGTGVIKSCGDGWHRISYQVTADHSTTSVVRILMKSGGSNSYLGDSYSGILLWGMQVEIGNAQTSYIKTTTSATETRSADFCSVAVSEFAGFSDTEGTLFAEGSYNNTSASSTPVTVQDAAHTEYAKIYLSTNQQVYAYVRGSGSDQAYTSAGSVSGENLFKSALRYDENNIGISLNGGTTVTDTSATMPIGMTTLYIGRSSKTWDVLNGNLKRVAYYSAPLSDTNLSSITS